jgi:RNA polymerase sigma-70 factor (ECF subfamily)
VDTTLGPEALLVQAETLAEIAQAVRQLPPKQRAAFVLRYYLELSEAETAEKLQCSPGTVKQHLHRARQRLAQMLRRGSLS